MLNSPIAPDQPDDAPPQLSPLIQAAYDAAAAAWPELLAKYPRQVALYHGSQLLGVEPDGTKLYHEYIRRGYRDDELMTFYIEAEVPSPHTESYE